LQILILLPILGTWEFVFETIKLLVLLIRVVIFFVERDDNKRALFFFFFLVYGHWKWMNNGESPCLWRFM
jgi:hypothetical protein